MKLVYAREDARKSGRRRCVCPFQFRDEPKAECITGEGTSTAPLPDLCAFLVFAGRAWRI